MKWYTKLSQGIFSVAVHGLALLLFAIYFGVTLGVKLAFDTPTRGKRKVRRRVSN